MSKAQKIIGVLNDVFGESELPLCVSVLDDEGMELYSSKACSSQDASTKVLGLIAFEELTKSLSKRSHISVDMLYFRTGDYDYYVYPVGEAIFLCAVYPVGKVGQVMSFLDGLGAQISHALRSLA